MFSESMNFELHDVYLILGSNPNQFSNPDQGFYKIQAGRENDVKYFEDQKENIETMTKILNQLERNQLRQRQRQQRQEDREQRRADREKAKRDEILKKQKEA